MKKKLSKVAKDINDYLKRILRKQKKNRSSNFNEVWFVARR